MNPATANTAASTAAASAAVDTVADTARALATARQILGDVTLVRDHSWPHRESTVLEVADRAARRWIVKRCCRTENFAQEITAYREWVHALEGRAPTLVDAVPENNTIVLTREPGEITDARHPQLHACAGALVRRFHSAAPARPAGDFAERMRERLELGLARADGLFATADVDFVRGQVASIAELPPVVHVPTHQDNQPRNWLVDRDGVVRLIDFGLSRWDVWVRDLVRLYYWDWRHDPDLAEAFLDGYGRLMSADELQLLRALGALTAVMTVLWAREHGDAGFAMRGWKALEVARAEGR